MSISYDGTATNNLDMGAGRNFLRNVAGASVMGWGLITAFGTTRAMIAISVGTSTSTRFKMSVLSAGAVELRCRALDGEAGSQAFNTGSTVLTVSRRFHIACVMDYTNKVGSIYIDGDVVAAAQLSALTANATSDTAAVTGTIGAHETGTTAPWLGQLEDCRVYGRVVGASEIKTIVTCEGRDNIRGALEGRWMCNEQPVGAAVSLVPDLSGNTYALAISGALTYATGLTLPRRRRQAAQGRH
jgi:hypothetical protein